MYICICNQVSDREIRQAASIGIVEFADLQSTLGVATCCGKCTDCAKAVLSECRAAVATQAA